MEKKNIKKNNSVKSAQPRITRAASKLNEKQLIDSKSSKKSDRSKNLNKASPLVSAKKLDEALVSVKLSPRVTRSKNVLKPAKQIDENLNCVSGKNLDNVTDSVIPRITRSKVKKTPIDDTLKAPTTVASSLKVVKRADFTKLNDFKVNDFVLAKQKYSCPWPAKILSIEKGKVLVYFFGDKRSGFVQSSELYDFTKSFCALRSIILSKKKPAGFITAIREVELLLGINGASSILNSF